MLGRDDKAVARFRASLGTHRMGAQIDKEEWISLDQVFRLLDQKATSMLTYLAILLAGMSILLVGGNTGAEREWVWVAFLSIQFGMLFLSAFLCLSVTILKLAPREGKETFEGTPQTRMRDASGRVWRFQAAYWLSVASSAGFAVLVFTRLLSQFFR